jgi:hypothetical protein
MYQISFEVATSAYSYTYITLVVLRKERLSDTILFYREKLVFLKIRQL